MEKLCIKCTGFVEMISNNPNVLHYGSRDFATFSQIKAVATTCTFCNIFLDSIQRMTTKIDFSVTIQIHWLVSKPGPTLIMLDLRSPENDPIPDHLSMVKLLSAEGAISTLPLPQRYLISYRKSEKPLSFSSTGKDLSPLFMITFSSPHIDRSD
jgi:hypothetical protein